MLDTVETNPNSEKPFVTLSQAIDELTKLKDLAPKGGTLLGITCTYVHLVLQTTPKNDEATRWLIGATIEVPRTATMLGGTLASLGLPYSTRSIQFVVKGEVAEEDAYGHSVHNYTVYNGSFELTREPEPALTVESKPFRDPELRSEYDSVFDTTDFERLLEVVRSEVSGEEAVCDE